ncbi:hypothetical protein D9619_010699 [Psilocybe cf. subviscida]|uniref:J domain-containing protein n=1 Tax=Psilocybe cf. subviscida TaxID=2480587 RepID=A0A8H5F050_9AGAR|nr:hypothetical protein D9619_010699 [Psilocybe cf. subviscida]
MGEEREQDALEEKDGYLYAVLNLTKEASAADINERHRSLSLIFHPDKQTDEQLKKTAAKEFLKIQKAYQVLSDPFLRRVYDKLGPRGVKIDWPDNVRTLLSEQERVDLLFENKTQLERQELKAKILPKARLTWHYDSSPLFMAGKSPHRSWLSEMYERYWQTRTVSRTVSYAIEKKLSSKTAVAIEGQSTVAGRQAIFQFLGTVRHQFSPRLVTLAKTNIFFPFNSSLEVKYEDPHNALSLQSSIQPLHFSSSPPVTSISYTRRLFSSTPQQGKITLRLAKVPALTIQYISPPVVDVPKGQEDQFTPGRGPPTSHGFKFTLVDKTFGLNFESIFPQLVAEVGVTLLELSTRFHCAITFGLFTRTGFAFKIGSHWSNSSSEMASTLILTNTGIHLDLECGYLEQRLNLPITLSPQFSPLLALSTIVVPSIATISGYYFFVIPKRKARRKAHLRAIKQEFAQDTDARRERDAVAALLKDPVKRQLRHEAEQEGLIVQEAMYKTVEEGDRDEGIALDVKLPLQALVRHSQLHIPGGSTKSALQGFSDPAPFASKILCVRYSFRGREHYAEIPDYLPVVLPLAEHQLNFEH